MIMQQDSFENRRQRTIKCSGTCMGFICLPPKNYFCIQIDKKIRALYTGHTIFQLQDQFTVHKVSNTISDSINKSDFSNLSIIYLYYTIKYPVEQIVRSTSNLTQKT